MTKEIRELRSQKSELVVKAKAALAEGKTAEVKELNAQITVLNDKLEVAERLYDEEQRNINPADNQPQTKMELKAPDPSKDMRTSNEYMRSFFLALGMGVNANTGKGIEGLKPLYDAISATGGTPAGEDGGFLLPVDFDNLIWTLRRDFTALADLVTVENVQSYTGWRAVERFSNTAGFASMTELVNMAEVTGEPKFDKITYTMTDYGGYMPVANSFLSDTSVNVMNYLAKWMARKAVNTENALILAKWLAMSPVTFDKTKLLDSLKIALNVTLDPAISARANIVLNQDAFNFLDTMKDAEGNYLLKPDVTNPTAYTLKGRPVKLVSNAILSTRNASGHTYAPIILGDFTEQLDLFRRTPYEMASTTIGGVAWRQNATEVRGIVRLDLQTIDAAAATKLEIQLT
jgi:HK97 family phage major capsid protein